jgi:hypothetical protein
MSEKEKFLKQKNNFKIKVPKFEILAKKFLGKKKLFRTLFSEISKNKK